MPSLLNNASYNDNNMATNSTVEEVTNDDLQAMKNMIGDISLLVRYGPSVPIFALFQMPISQLLDRFYAI